MRTTITATATLLLTLTACGADTEAAPSEPHHVGDTVTVAEDPNSDIQTTLDLALTSYECGRDTASELVLYSDGTKTTRRAEPAPGYEYCSFDLTVTNTGDVPTPVMPWAGNVIVDGQRIAPAVDGQVNTFAVEAALAPADRLNPGVTIDYTIYRALPSGTVPEAVEITRSQHRLDDTLATIVLD